MFHVEYYKCRKCDYWRTVETLGQVMHVPDCPVCKSKMKKFMPMQTELKISQKHSNRR